MMLILVWKMKCKNGLMNFKSKGHKPFVIPIGGSTGLGALGYVKAMEELSAAI